MKTIDSIKDEKIVLARSLQTLKGREQHGRMLLEGEQILDWAIAYQIPIEYVLVAKRTAPALIDKYLSQGIDLYEVSTGIQKKVAGRSYLVPVLGVGQMLDDPSSGPPDFLMVLDNVKDFGNIGTIIRTCHAFGIHNLVSTTHTLDLYQKKTIEASRGSVFATRLTKLDSGSAAVRFLQKKGYQIVATSPRGKHIQSLVELEQKPVALVVGNETTGVSPEIEAQADYLVQIPMSDEMESLNVGVATGISVYELKLKQVISMIEEKIKATLGRELNVAGMLVQKALDIELEKISNLNSQQVIFMMVLRCDREMSEEDMCKQFGILPSEVDQFLEPLLHVGLITNEENLKMTAKGEEHLSKLWFTVEKTEGQILAGLSDAEIQNFKRTLTLIQQNCIHAIRDHL